MQKTPKFIITIATIVTSIEAVAVFIASNLLNTADVYFIESLLIMLVPLFLLNVLIVAKTPIYDVSLDSLKQKENEVEKTNELAVEKQQV